MEHLSSSLLYAIQEIPGETRNEKFKEIGRIVSHIIEDIQKESDFTTAVIEQNVPNALVPLIKVLVGVKIKSLEFITEALKSDNIYLIIEALRAKWFYDGSNKSITNYKYFSTALFPFVSINTRREIVKKLAVGLANQVKLAEDFFDGFAAAYGAQEATNLLPACSSEFVFEAIVRHKIVLSNKVLKKLYRKHPDVVVRYLKFMLPCDRRDEIGHTMFWLLDTYEYENFIPLLVTKHLDIFVIMQEIFCTKLGNRRTMMFLKNAKHILIEKPRDLIGCMPLKLVCDNLKESEFETMFSNLLEWDEFDLNDTLYYLEYYPKKKRATLLRDKIKAKFGFDLYEKVEKITPTFILLLPKEECYSLTRRIIEMQDRVELSDSETCWWSYLPIQEAILALKFQIAKNWKTIERKKLFSELIYVCKLNESKEVLLEVIKFVDENYKREEAKVICSMLDRITQEFDLDTFDQDFWIVLFSLIKRIKLKNDTARDYWVLIKILKKNVHYCNNHHLPSDEIIELIVRLFLEGRVGVSWMLLEDDAEYERRYLDVCFKNSCWMNMNYNKNVIAGIYNFNERHVNSNNLVQRFSIKDYPHLMKIVEETLKKQQNKQMSWILYTKEKLKKHEPELYSNWFPDEYNSESGDFYDDVSIGDDKGTPEVKKKTIYITEAIIALKKNYVEIKDNWDQYYDYCKNEVTSKKQKRVKLFLTALRWYQDVPIKFAERSIEERNFNMMGHMFDGTTLYRLVETFLPKEIEEDHYTTYQKALNISAAIKNTTTPIPIDLVQNYFQAHYMYSFKNYISEGLSLWSHVSYRTSSDRMIVLAKNLTKDMLLMKKHAIQLMSAIAARGDVLNFFADLWETEENPKIREMIAEKICELFSKRPNDETWKLLDSCIEDVSFLAFCVDNVLLNLMKSKAIPVQYASAYAERIMRKIDDFVDNGMSGHNTAKLLDQLFGNLKPDCKDMLSEEFYKRILSTYLQNTYLEFTNAERFIVELYLNPNSVHFEDRLKHLSTLLSAESKRWYGLSMERRKLSPNVVNNVVLNIVYQVQKFKGNLKLVESLSNIYQAIFPPCHHAWSHVMLYLCTEYLRLEPSFNEFGINVGELVKSTFKEFGVRVGQNICCLVDTYTPEYFMQLVEIIKEFIFNFSFYEYRTYIRIHILNFFEGLIASNNAHGYIIVSKLINEKIQIEFSLKHRKIFQQLSEINNPIVQSLL